MRTLSTTEIGAIAGGTFCCTPHPVCKPVCLPSLLSLLSCLKISFGSCEPKKPTGNCGGGTSTGGGDDEPYLG